MPRLCSRCVWGAQTRSRRRSADLQADDFTNPTGCRAVGAHRPKRIPGSRPGLRSEPSRACPLRLPDPLQRGAPTPFVAACPSDRLAADEGIAAQLGRRSPGRAGRADPRVPRCCCMTERVRSAAAVFVVARNPEDDSKLPYLLRLPLEGGLVLKARESWPATSRVYCHPFAGAWPEDAKIVEQTRSSRAAGAEQRSTLCSIVPGWPAPSSSSRR